MSRLSSRVSSTVAGLAIVMLVVFLMILWARIKTTGSVKNTVFRGIPTSQLQCDFKGDLGALDSEAAGTSVDESSNVTDVSSASTRHEVHHKRGDFEYIQLVKISQNQYEDSPASGNIARHHSGYFRHSAAEVWDPHPQYKFTAFGRHFRLRLNHDSSFISESIQVTHSSENKTKWELPDHQLSCFYTGFIDGVPNSVVSVSLCHGMTGHMKTFSRIYTIEPVDTWKDDENFTGPGSTRQHAIRLTSINSHDVKSTKVSDRRSNCGIIDYDLAENPPVPLIDNSTSGRIYLDGHGRKRRQLTENDFLYFSVDGRPNQDFEELVDHNRRWYSHPIRRKRERIEDANIGDGFNNWRARRALPREYFIEIMVVADAKMVDYHGSSLVGYILILMSTELDNVSHYK